MVVRVVVLYGAVLAALGVLWPVLRGLGISGLPGDFVTHVGALQVPVPIASAALVSVIVGALFWLTGRKS